MNERRAAFAGVVVLSLAAVGAALMSQYRYDMQPCPWCVLQRVLFVAIALVALLGMAGHRVVERAAAGGVMLLAACGVAAALWQHFVAASSTSCALTLADRIVRGLGLDELWPEGFSATASCADAAVKLLGIPYEFFSLALFAGLLWAGWTLLRAPRPGPTPPTPRS